MRIPMLATLALVPVLGLAALACKSASASYGPDGWHVQAEGDDTQLVEAKGWEAALKQAEQNLVNAQNATPPNPDFVKDWKDIVDNTMKAKKRSETAEVEEGFHWEYEGDDVSDGN